MKKILIIHNHASIWESLAEALAADGYLVVPISQSALVREMILTLVPDLVLLDWHMDEKDKGDVFEEVKKQAPYMHLLALAMDDHSPKGLYGSSADVCVMKSPCVSGLRQKVAAVLQPKTGNSRESQKNEIHPT